LINSPLLLTIMGCQYVAIDVMWSNYLVLFFVYSLKIRSPTAALFSFFACSHYSLKECFSFLSNIV